MKLSSTCVSFADSSKAVQNLLIVFFKFIFHVFTLSSPGDIYVINLTFTLYCGSVWGRGRNQGVPRLVLKGCGIAVPEIFGAIREDSRLCVYVRIPAHQIVSNRSLSLWAQKVLFARANAF